MTPTLAIVDPALTQHLPTTLTVDTGIDVLTHAVEGYTNRWYNDFCDGLCLKAAQLVFTYLPQVVAAGADNLAARERMSNAATLAGLGFGNSFAGLAHAMGHSFGAYFKTPHGRTVGLFLPYTMEYNLLQGDSRYGELARFLGFTVSQNEKSAGKILVEQIRALEEHVGQPTTIAALGIPQAAFQAALSTLVTNAETDNAILATWRTPAAAELQELFVYAYEGRVVDF